MLRRAVRILALGVIVVAAGLYVFEFIASDYVTPHVTLVQWSVLAVAVILVLYLKNRDTVVNHHLPH
jgi:hypothetical protein